MINAVWIQGGGTSDGPCRIFTGGGERIADAKAEELEIVAFCGNGKLLL